MAANANEGTTNCTVMAYFTNSMHTQYSNHSCICQNCVSQLTTLDSALITFIMFSLTVVFRCLHTPAITYTLHRCLHTPAITYRLHRCNKRLRKYEGNPISELQIMIEKKRMEIMTHKQHPFFNIISTQI
jgi:hypothetical protein